MTKTAPPRVFGVLMLLLAAGPAFAEGAQERIDALSQQIASDPDNQQLYHQRGRALLRAWPVCGSACRPEEKLFA